MGWGQGAGRSVPPAPQEEWAREASDEDMDTTEADSRKHRTQPKGPHIGPEKSNDKTNAKVEEGNPYLDIRGDAKWQEVFQETKKDEENALGVASVHKTSRGRTEAQRKKGETGGNAQGEIDHTPTEGTEETQVEEERWAGTIDPKARKTHIKIECKYYQPRLLLACLD